VFRQSKGNLRCDGISSSRKERPVRTKPVTPKKVDEFLAELAKICELRYLWLWSPHLGRRNKALALRDKVTLCNRIISYLVIKFPTTTSTTLNICIIEDREGKRRREYKVCRRPLTARRTEAELVAL